MTRRKQRANSPPDIEIGARASARKVRFRRKPSTKVQFEGGTQIRSDDRIEEIELDSESGSERRNLPEEVEPGVTYRNIAIGWAARARARLSREEDEKSEDRDA